MNINKAREFFSAYYENKLDLGLKQSFERELRSDAQIQVDIGPEMVQEFALNGRRLKSPLGNASKLPVLLSILDSETNARVWIALPGSRRIAPSVGDGTPADLAVALSGYFQTPI